ncbi:MAG: methionine--tRNA ligase, partial [Myxococcales bacterium]|nr:methionine--tRNA ligase [Myxococcales bacterium]
HLGHLVEYIQADIYVRARRQAGEEVYFFCAADSHGTPIELNANKQGIEPEELVERARAGFLRDFADFGVTFDAFHSTHSPENRALSGSIYQALKDRGEILRREVDGLYCEHDERFLPDRFVRGRCPKCGADDQYGDNCELCGATYDPSELGAPACALCGNEPSPRSSEHLFFDLPRYEDSLAQWMEGALQPAVHNFVKCWLNEGLKPWDISRDGPYFGFEIPGETDKYFYVWLDAPVGYISTARHWATQQGKEDPDYLWRGDAAQRTHIIGKDIVYFHSLFWPAMLMGSGWGLPDRIHVHGFLQVDGEKMSKSRGTFITARQWADHLPCEYLRFYYACRLNDEANDLNLDFEDFSNTLNGELVNKVVNLASRALGFLNKKLDSELGEPDAEGLAMIEGNKERLRRANQHFAAFQYHQGMRCILAAAEEANEYLQEKAPWAVFKEDPEAARVILSGAVGVVAQLTVALEPIVPELCQRLAAIVGIELHSIEALDEPLGCRKVAAFQRLAERITPQQLEALVEANREEAS